MACHKDDTHQTSKSIHSRLKVFQPKIFCQVYLNRGDCEVRCFNLFKYKCFLLLTVDCLNISVRLEKWSFNLHITIPSNFLSQDKTKFLVTLTADNFEAHKIMSSRRKSASLFYKKLRGENEIFWDSSLIRLFACNENLFFLR